MLFLPDVMSNLQLGPVHKATIEKHGKEWTKPGNIVGNGAFVLSDWQVNSKVVLTKNYRYWDAKNVQLTKWTYLPVEDGNADVKLFESGENDWVYQLPPGTYDKYKAQWPKEIRNTPMLGLRYYSLHNQDPLLKDIRMRKALSMVIDRDILAESHRRRPIGRLWHHCHRDQRRRPDDLRLGQLADGQARGRAKKAARQRELRGPRSSSPTTPATTTRRWPSLPPPSGNPSWASTLRWKPWEFKVLIKKRDDGQYQMARNGWIADYNDATTFLTLVQCDSAQNSQRNCNRKTEELINQGKARKPATRPNARAC